MKSFFNFSKRYVASLWPWYLGGIVALVVTNLATLEIPQLAKFIVNRVESSTPRSELQQYALGLIALGVGVMVIRALSRIFIFYPGRKLETRLRVVFFARMLSLSERFYENFGMGELIARLNNDVGQLRAFYAFGVLQLLNLVFLSVFTINNMLHVHALLTCVALGPLVLLVGFMKSMFTKMHELSRINQEAVGKLTNRVTEAFVNVHVIKANAAEECFATQAEIENQAVYTSNVNSVVQRTVLFPLMNSLMNLGQVGVVFYGGYEVLQGRLTVGDILAFNVYIAYLAFPLSAIGIIISLYQRCIIALQRLGEIENAPVESGQYNLEIRDHVPILEIRNLNFAHAESNDDKDRFALSGLNLALGRGEKIGIYGAIGSGKSTLFYLISRIKDPPPGTIFIFGQDITTLNPHSLREVVAYAQQTVHLFSASVADNLSFGMTSASQAQLDHAAGSAEVLGDILQLPEQWQAPIGEKGIRLSGGQRQRLALARIFLRQPQLMLLDDTLSAVDQRTEQRLTERIRQTKSAVLLASHRISALRDCKEILILDEGRIVDRGSFADMRLRHPAFVEEQSHEQN